MHTSKFPAAGAALVSLLAASAALADTQTPSSPFDTDPILDFDTDEMTEDIIVIAGRAAGSVISNLEAEQILDQEDIQAYGASSLQELIAGLAAETTSIRGRGGSDGRPIVLLNGQRVSGFREIHNIPPEAIERMEIFPEETALSYGYRADQRVVNVILKDSFASQTLMVSVGAPTAGHRTDLGLEASLFRVSGDSRLLLDLSLEHSNAVLESAHNVIQRDQALPYALGGNIVAVDGQSEIDPALSALVGESVTIAGVPIGNLAPGLSDFTPNAANSTDMGRYRTLLPRTTDFSAGASITRPLSQDIGMTLSARLTASTQQSRQGLANADVLLPSGNPWSPFANDVRILAYADAPGPLLRDSSSWGGRVAAAFNGQTMGWSWTLTASHDHDETKTTTDRGIDQTFISQRLLDADPGFNPFAPNAINGPLLQEHSKSNRDYSQLEANANGRLVELPAGAVATSVKFGLDHRRQKSRTERLDGTREAKLNRTEGNAQLSLDIPIASRNRDVLQPLGDLSVNANANVDRYSDFGTLYGWGGGLTWRPIPALQLVASYTSEKGAPSVQQLGDPQIATPNVPIFDYVRGEAVEVIRLDGGNPGLLADHRQSWKIGGRLQPFSNDRISLQADFVRTTIDNPVAGFPAVTAEMEAAFPNRFERDADGRLILLDNRSVNFSGSKRSELRWGLNFSQILGASPGGQGAGRGQGRGPGGRMAGGSGGRGGGAGRLRLSLFHSLRLEDRILIRDGLAELDMLNGSAAGSRGGTPRHLLEGQLMLMKSGFGGFLTADWQSGTSVATTGPGISDRLHFSDLTTVNLRLFVNLGDQKGLIEKASWLENSRLSLEVNNMLNQRINVHDSAGNTPASYQSWYMDPVGRSVSLSWRKMFF